jgi:hypothetical protein
MFLSHGFGWGAASRRAMEASEDAGGISIRRVQLAEIQRRRGEKPAWRMM